VELLPTKGEENEEKSNERESGKDRAECFDKPATQQLSEGRDFPGVEQKRRGQSQRKPSNESSDADVEPFQGPFGREARLATAYDKTMATVTTSVISSWNGNSGIPPPPPDPVVVVSIELVAAVEVVEVLEDVVLVDDLEVLLVVDFVVEVVVVLVVVVVEVVVVLARGEYANVVVFQMGFVSTEPLQEALTVYVPLIQLLVPPAPNV